MTAIIMPAVEYDHILLALPLGQVRPGDILLDGLGDKPLMRVVCVIKAKARGYFVLTGVALTPTHEGRTSGHKDLRVQVLRPVSLA